MALTLKQDNFCLAVVELGDNSAAYRKAYNAKNMKPETINRKAKELMDNGKIAARIAELRAPAIKKAELTAEYVLNGLMDIAERCRQAEPVLDREGNETGEYRFDSSGANKALELLGKHLGLFKDRTELTGKDGGPLQVERKVDLSKLTREELLQLDRTLEKTT